LAVIAGPDLLLKDALILARFGFYLFSGFRAVLSFSAARLKAFN
jgi:hypothetical protein